MGQGRERWVRLEGGYERRESVGGDNVVHSSTRLSDTTEVHTVWRKVLGYSRGQSLTVWRATIKSLSSLESRSFYNLRDSSDVRTPQHSPLVHVLASVQQHTAAMSPSPSTSLITRRISDTPPF